MDKTEAEKTLNSQVLEYEKAYFEDMTFQPGSIAGDIFVECEQQIFSKQKWKEYWDIPGAGFHLPIKQYPFRLKRLKGAYGQFSVKQGLVFIHPNSNNLNTILHEMIHAYDWTLDRCYPYPLRDILIIRLYDKLKTRIIALDKLLMTFSHYFNQFLILDGKEGEHGILFYLKCLDLEIRLNVPFGSISGFYSEKRIRVTHKNSGHRGAGL
jgi:hypothetical protein